MKYIIDTSTNTLSYEKDNETCTLSLYSHDAFEIISKNWLKIGWSLKYAYQFTWLGRPVIQLPDDLIRIQEVIFSLRPDIIIETGVAYGGSLIFYASLCKIIGCGRVIGVERFLRPENRNAITSDALSSYISLIDGDSTNAKTLARVKAQINKEDKVLVILDSNHSKQHVLKELEAYCEFITPGSYIIATDGLMKELHDAPHGKENWIWDNPVTAVDEFAIKHPEFEKVAAPPHLFNKSLLSSNATQWPNGWLKRK
jgi:cephalosporin hydroxylase